MEGGTADAVLADHHWRLLRRIRRRGHDSEAVNAGQKLELDPFRLEVISFMKTSRVLFRFADSVLIKPAEDILLERTMRLDRFVVCLDGTVIALPGCRFSTAPPDQVGFQLIAVRTLEVVNLQLESFR
jgi:hypothetical protein